MAFKKYFYCSFLLTFVLFGGIYAGHAQPVRVLFDATKAEMAGNADWVIDADQTDLGVGASGAYLSSPGHQSNPQQIPTPPQSGIAGSTAETYWTGALSSWGIDCVNKGYTVETLPWNGQITYSNAANAQDLSNYNIYIIDEPNIPFTATEKTALIQFVQNGGGLFIISDHNNSDRNGDGWDSPHVWNDLFSNNSVSVNPFGITFDLADFSQTTTNIADAADDSVIHGPMGNVTKVEWSDGTTMTLDTAINPTIKGVIFKTGAAPGITNAMVAYGRYGSGKIAAMGDSSPSDDGTGNPNCELYNGYWTDAAGNHRLLLMNMTIWLAGKISTDTTHTTSGIGTVPLPDDTRISIYPNPATGILNLTADHKLTDAVLTVYTATGAEVFHKALPLLDKNEPYSFSLPGGFYYARIESGALVQTSKIIVCQR